ncbi:NAD-dependent epimerase/dehydratase family protein [Variovorax sp. RT4R15]|uniref:NAD-dependent epimerase/dehydratase family protein n=1 Tax=Variovorax sp. RT4R15 TaxID=3443737 RepID=UPI003F46C729
MTNPKLFPTGIRFGRLLLTGAAGSLGRELRGRLSHYCETLRLSDIVDLGANAPHEELRPASLQNEEEVDRIMDGVDAVVHLGGVPIEREWESILQSNIVGTYNLYEAARKHGVRRLVFASTSHVTGFYRQDQRIDPAMPVRPDGLYGLSKAFGENLSRLYFDRYGIETVCIRIGAPSARPSTRRTLAMWLSHDDLERLIMSALTAPVVGHTVLYGVSDNAVSWWNNQAASLIGYRPQDSSECFRQEVEQAQPTIDLNDRINLYQGGFMLTEGVV